MDVGTERIVIIPSIISILIVAALAFIIIKTLQLDIRRIRNKRQSTIKREPVQQLKEISPNPAKLPYYLKDSVFTFHESILYEILDEFCRNNSFVLLSKIRIADFVNPYNQKNFYHWFNRISAKHVDFLLCQPKTYKPILAIELDDYTHNYKNRRERDEFVNQVYYSVGLPILHITELRQTVVERNIAEILDIKIKTFTEAQQERANKK